MAKKKKKQNKKAKRMQIAFKACIILCLCMSMICIGSVIARTVVRNEAYASYTELADATDISARKRSYIQAIALCPGRADAYILLLDVFGEDGVFTKAESEEFLGLYNANQRALGLEDPGYGMLHYKAGLLYVHGYEGASTAAKLRMALPFLEIASQYVTEDSAGYMAVQCYCCVGRLYRDYIWDASAIKEIPQEKIQEMVQEVQDTLDAFQKDSSADSIYNRLGFSLAACNLLLDQRDLLAIIVPQDTVMEILNEIYEELPQMQSLQQPATRQLLALLMENEQTYRDMLQRAYERSGSLGS